MNFELRDVLRALRLPETEGNLDRSLIDKVPRSCAVPKASRIQEIGGTHAGEEETSSQAVASKQACGSSDRKTGQTAKYPRDVELPAAGNGKHIVGVKFKKKPISKALECLGQMTLHVDTRSVGSGDFRTQTGHYALFGEGLCIGRDSGDAVSKEYKPQFPFTDGLVINVVYDVADDAYVDVERKFAAALARD